MQCAGLIVNSKAGRGSSFETRLDDMLRVFAQRNLTVQVAHTTAAPDSARKLAVRASENCELVIACGGDGTVHGVLQGVADTPTCLGVLPFGTANALARNLGLPLDPVAALEKLLGFCPRQIPLGIAETDSGTRWFAVMAGAGPDGRLVHEMKVVAKSVVGRRAYYAEAARLFVSRRFPAFQVDYRMLGSRRWETQEAVAMMASRIPDLGGIFRGLTSNSRLHRPHLLVQLLAAPAHLSFPAWFAFGRAGLGHRNPWLTTLAVEELRSLPLAGSREVFAQVDGEAFGPIPMSVGVRQNALRLMMP